MQRLITVRKRNKTKMSEKVLQEFSAKISKAKNLFEATKNQCELLRREKEKLEKEYK